ncbi:MAG: MCE family protein [Thermoleophilaceae bacterium]|nr:MCE family protein [Thermoleophilaceae bacterium]
MTRRLVAALVVVAVVVGAVLASGAREEGKGGQSYKIEFDNAFGLTEGGDFRVGGVNAGSTTTFDTRRIGDRTVAVVGADVTEKGFGDLRKDATCEIRPQSVIGEYFVDCQPGGSSEKLATGGTIPVKQTTSTIPVDLVNNILRRPYRERLQLIIGELGAGLAGRPQDLQVALKKAHPGLRETSKVLRILGNQNKVIQDFITDSDTVVAELEKRKTDVARFVTEAGETAEITATRRTALKAQLRLLPRFLDEFRPTLVSLGELSDEQIPTLRDLRAAAPALTSFLEELGPFSEASRPAVRSLGKASVTGRKALSESADEIDTLRALSADAPGFAKPLRQFLETIDDRGRAIETDPRAAQTAPPAPDKVAANTGKGFTGMESLLNYAYWQTLAVNSFDEFSHVLRTGIFLSECGEYNNDPTEEIQERCGSYTGPYQPGLRGKQDDYTKRENSRKRERLEREDGRAPRVEREERRSAGQPEAGPRPGETDPSKPRVVLPKGLQDLVDNLKGDLPVNPTLPELEKALPPELQKQLPPELQNQLPSLGGSGNQQNQGVLLDYLLAR